MRQGRFLFAENSRTTKAAPSTNSPRFFRQNHPFLPAIATSVSVKQRWLSGLAGLFESIGQLDQFRVTEGTANERDTDR